ncbi:mitochondrial ribosome-associated GTPase 2 [Diabrotica undecimpunctata]|uniref:mitochondrial ribosome-associated GTPase 2 n=1 Tax=Diabrotica undecimpunctata TaxID=50387 RepID=UPI003B636B9C
MINAVKINIRLASKVCKFSQDVAQPLRSKKPKSLKNVVQNFVDLKNLRAIGGKGGDGCISYLSLFSNEFAGPDGGDGGNGGHIIFKSSESVKDLNHIPTVAKAKDGEKGSKKDCNGKNADHLTINVPIGTIIKNAAGKVVGDLSRPNLMFVAARGGAGGKGNHYFVSDTQQSPMICEYGADGEDLEYTVEVKSMANIGLIGFPNAGKSTLLRAISRAKPKVAPYPFTTLKPHIGIVQYDDYEQVAVADLPGLIQDSHKNKGLGIEFLRHAERCMALLIILDSSEPEPWKKLEVLQYELSQFNDDLKSRPQLVIANKMDLPGAEPNIEQLKKMTALTVIPISAKLGLNISLLLKEVKILYDRQETNK